MVWAQKQTQKSVEQNREPRNKPMIIYGQLIFDKGGNDIQWSWEEWRVAQRRMKLDCFLTPDTKINSKWMKDLNVRQEAIKLLKKKADKNLFDFGRSNFLLNMSPKARETKAKMNYWDLIKIKSFCTAKETISKTKRQPTEWEKIFANDISEKGLVSKIYNLSNSIPKNQIIQ